jgi:tetratricopeptide (TPR) repeat protein
LSKAVLEKSLSYIKWYSDRGIGNNKYMDFEWLQDKYIPALSIADKPAKTNQEKFILSNGYYLLGDIYDLTLSVPSLAIKAYGKSIKYDPLNAAAHRELGVLLVQNGYYRDGIRHLKKAAKLWPEDDYAAHELRELENDPDYRKVMTEPISGEEALASQATELILSGKAQHALEILKGKRGLEFRMMRANAYASIDMTGNYLAEWDRISKLKDSIHFTGRDWFFITDEIWNKSRIWDILQSMEGRFEPSYFFIVQGLENSLKAPKKRTKDNSLSEYTPGFKKHINKKYSLYCRAQSARVRGDKDELLQLKKKYPAWRELDSFIRKIKKS